MKEIENQSTKKLEQTPFNKIVKELDKDKKKEFKQKLLNHPLIWAPDKPLRKRAVIYNNWRYMGTGDPSFPTKVVIYILLRRYKYSLIISDIFPDINHNEIEGLITIVEYLQKKLSYEQ